MMHSLKGMLCTSQSPAAKYWYTWSEECCPLCRRMLHGGMPQLPFWVPHSFKCLKRSMRLPLKSELIQSLEICCPSREQHAYPYKTFHISLWCREAAVVLGNNMKSPVNQKCCFLLFMLAHKTCSIVANITYRLSVAKPVKIEFHVSLTFIGSIQHFSIQYFIEKAAVLQNISTTLNFASWFTGWLSGPCSLLLPDVQTSICAICTQDLKPKVLPQYVRAPNLCSTTAKPHN